MDHGNHVITFTAIVERFEGPGGWHAVFLPTEAASEARFFGRPNALGAIAVEACIGSVCARTSLFPDRKRETYMLPLKAALRQQASIIQGETIGVTLTLRD